MRRKRLVSQERRDSSSSKFRSNSTRRRTTIKVDLKSSRCNMAVISISAIRTATITTACPRRGRDVIKLRILFPWAKTESKAGPFNKTLFSVTSSCDRKASWDQCQPIQQLQTTSACLAIIKSSISSTLALRQISLSRNQRQKTQSPRKVWAANNKTWLIARPTNKSIRLSLSSKWRSLIRLKYRRWLRRLRWRRLRSRPRSLISLRLTRLRRPSRTRFRTLLRRRLRSLLRRTSLRFPRSLSIRRNKRHPRLNNKSQMKRRRGSCRNS